MNPTHKKIDVPVYFDFDDNQPVCTSPNNDRCLFLFENHDIYDFCVCLNKELSGGNGYVLPDSECPLHGGEDE
jgi:hypothetical protein